ncbi:MAG: copper amine oxidase N-terminal domain-containing protein [Oscillospiraceae bacterium]|nr:copper amine oxidase N-terminal domain-containing protein [Oscillospiraceae bacterium]
MKKVRTFLVGFLSAVILMGLALPAIAAGSTVTWDSVFVGVNIVIDGEKLEPKDVNGNPVDAVIYKGTTYLPVRAVAEALGVAVNWDGDTRTVYLGDVPAKPQPEPEKEPEPQPAAGNEDYIGTYRIYGIEGKSLEEYLSDLIQETMGEDEDLDLKALMAMFRAEFQDLLTLELKADGTCVLTYEDQTMELNWKVEGETLTLSADGEEIDCAIKDGIISIAMDDMSIQLSK